MTDNNNDDRNRDQPRDAGAWAKPMGRIDRDTAEEIGASGLAGRRLTGPLQGFGKMWQKTYRVKLEGSTLEPSHIIREWKAEYGSFWPRRTRFYAPIAGIQPGEIGRIEDKQGPMRLSTGVLVLYSDDVSFAYMTPEGHPFAGWITFSSHREDEVPVAQVQLLIRPSDPLYEAGFALFGSRVEDKMWQHTLRSLATHLGVDAEPETEIVCVDKKRQWRLIGNVRHNAMIRSTLAAPFRVFRRSKSG